MYGFILDIQLDVSHLLVEVDHCLYDVMRDVWIHGLGDEEQVTSTQWLHINLQNNKVYKCTILQSRYHLKFSRLYIQIPVIEYTFHWSPLGKLPAFFTTKSSYYNAAFVIPPDTNYCWVTQKTPQYPISFLLHTFQM